MLTSIFRRVDASDDVPPAAATLAALKERIAALQAEDQSWVEKETASAKEVRDHDAAIAERQRLEEQHLDGLAQREISGTVPLSDAELEQRLEDARARELRLAERRRVAERVLVRMRAERQRIREAQIDCNQQLPATLHAVVREHLRALAPEFLAAEQAYLAALAKVYGAARVADKITRSQMQAGGPHLGWSGGDLNVTNIFTPRPAGTEFEPTPQRPAIARAIDAAADALEKSL